MKNFHAMAPGNVPHLRAFASPRELFLIMIMIFLLAAAPAFSSDTAPAAPPLSLDEALAAIARDCAGGPETAPVMFRWDPLFLSGAFIFGEHSAVFESSTSGEAGFLLLDGRELYETPLPWLEDGLLRFPASFVGLAGRGLSRMMEDETDRFRIAAVIIDPGHGGKDPGTIGRWNIDGRKFNSVEKDIVLDVSKKLYGMLSTAYPDKQIILTRDTDIFHTLEHRVSIANSIPLKPNEAIIFVSIHANSSIQNPTARGYEVWYLSPNYRRTVIDKSTFADNGEVFPILNEMMEEEFTTESIMIAQSILKSLGETVGDRIPSRGIKAEEWFVVRNARMPSVLVELGFVSNREDALLMKDGAYLRKLAEALYKGIGGFIANFEASGGFTTVR